ncbi:MAG: tRNA glutamyl-Q(34) synthetase GluQRS [Verrucomicrobiales bacterium]
MPPAADDDSRRPEITRFAPSPTGYLHLGHALAALVAWQAAGRSGGRFILRIEDIDRSRCRPEFESALTDDLRWLGLTWPEPVRRQSEHLDDYTRALDRLLAMNVVYPCFCTRAEIEREVAGMVNAPHGPDGPQYPGTCRHLSETERHDRLATGASHAWRMDVARATALTGPLEWTDRRFGRHQARTDILGDVVLARKDIGTSYHLAVVIDDAAQGVTLVTRGEDLLPCTHFHRLLQALLGLPVPDWAHHPLVRDETGRRLAKRNHAATLRHLRHQGLSAVEVRERLAWALNQVP